MIKLRGNVTRLSKAANGPFRIFETASEYYNQVAEKTSDDKDWPSLRLCKIVEPSNDLSFMHVSRNTIIVELTGTTRNVSTIESKYQDAPTVANDICQMPTGTSARFAWDAIDGQREALVLEFDDALFVNHCPEFITESFLSGTLLPSNFQQRPELASLVCLLARELEPERQRGRLFADSVIRLLSIEIASSAWSKKPLTSFENVIVDKRIRHALDYIETNFSHEITVADLTHVSGLNATHLTNCFRKQVGVTPYAHVLNRRIQQAVFLLNNTEQSIAQVALESGFADQQQLTHAFRKRLGQTPGSFRERN